MMNSPVVFILVDALRHDYLQVHGTAPFLSSLAQSGTLVEKVNPSLGYCERVEVLTGLDMAQHGFLTAIGRYKQGYSTYAPLKLLPSSMSNSRVIRKLLKVITRQLGVRLHPYQIPLTMLPFLKLTEDRTDHRCSNAFSSESLVDVMLEQGKDINWNFTALGYRNGNDKDRAEALKLAFGYGDSDLYMLYIGQLDQAGHEYGPRDARTGAVLGCVDELLQGLFRSLKQINPKTVFFILGDHGMSEVNTVIDVQTKMSQFDEAYGIKNGVDYEYFLDSTLCRFWGKTSRFRVTVDSLIRLFDDMDCGTWLPSGEILPEYGEFVWACDEGVLVFPDFFHTVNPCKGMHGYSPGNNNGVAGMAIIHGVVAPVANRRIPEAHLGAVAPTLCRLCGVRTVGDMELMPWA